MDANQKPPQPPQFQPDPPGTQLIGKIYMTPDGQHFSIQMLASPLNSLIVLHQLMINVLLGMKQQGATEKKLIVVPELTGIGPPPGSGR